MCGPRSSRPSSAPSRRPSSAWNRRPPASGSASRSSRHGAPQEPGAQNTHTHTHPLT
jgi:hypothetical protein